MRPLLVETVTADTIEGLRAARDASVHADIVELRLDGIGDIDVGAALADRTRPAIVTCRPAWEGGWFTGSEEDVSRFPGAVSTAWRCTQPIAGRRSTRSR